MLSVSVVVPVLNGAATIGDMLNALMSQSGAPEDREIIVVDNGSTDGTQAIVGRFPVTVLREEKRGPAAARNRGLRAARGEVIAHLDADTLPTRRWLAEIVAPFADPEVVLAGGRTLSFRPETAAERYIVRTGLYDTEAHLGREPFDWVGSLNMAVRRRAALAIGGWAEDMLTGEDIDFCYRLQRKFSSPIRYQSRAVLFHRTRQDDSALRRQAWTYGEGAAHLYARYPDVVRWDVRKSLHVARVVAWRSVNPLLLRIARAFLDISADELEFATYHRLWTWWYWKGFFSFRRHRSPRTPEVPAP